MPLILLIEDNHDIAAMVGEHLERSGYEVDYAADGDPGPALAADVAAGEARYAQTCVNCHGTAGTEGDAVTVDTSTGCARCHGDAERMKRYETNADFLDAAARA